MDDPALVLLQAVLETMLEVDGSAFSECHTLRIVSREGANVEIRPPRDLAKDLSRAADMVREEAGTHGEAGMVEALALEFEITGQSDPTAVTEWIRRLLFLYCAVGRALEA